jgi:hypothetical protein
MYLAEGDRSPKASATWPAELRNKGVGATFFYQPPDLKRKPMLALFLNHPPLFVAGEIVLGLSLALFVGALIASTVRGAPGISQSREAGHACGDDGLPIEIIVTSGFSGAT